MSGPTLSETTPLLGDREIKNAEASSPAPASDSKPKIPIVVIIPFWIALSVAVILYNNHLYLTLNLRFPVFLVTWHLIFTAIATRVLQRTTNLLDGTKDVDMNKDMFIRSFLPIGLLFSGSLILSNLAYLSISISYIQLLKAFMPVAVLHISWISRIVEPNWKLALTICIISSGFAMTATGEPHFRAPLARIEDGPTLCALTSLIALLFAEGLAPFYELARIGPLMLIGNAACIALILTLSGVLKDVLLIAAFILFFNYKVSPLQISGYSIAFAGLILFTIVNKRLTVQGQIGVGE
ncbi:hypothetical protein B0H19DRAFT_1218354 [Mycena capillaripes]|nr:hypothetical protein B0H19DRAFT_1218354 [Mycena capillaripes]